MVLTACGDSKGVQNVLCPRLKNCLSGSSSSNAFTKTCKRHPSSKSEPPGRIGSDNTALCSGLKILGQARNTSRMSFRDLNTHWKAIPESRRQILIRVAVHGGNRLELFVGTNHLPVGQSQASRIWGIQAVQQKTECIPAGVIHFIDHEPGTFPPCPNRRTILPTKFRADRDVMPTKLSSRRLRGQSDAIESTPTKIGTMGCMAFSCAARTVKQGCARVLNNRPNKVPHRQILLRHCSCPRGSDVFASRKTKNNTFEDERCRVIP